MPIVDSLIPILEAHKENQDREKAKAGSAWNKNNLVFCSNVGTIIELRRVLTDLVKITETAGMEHFSFHALRHSFATRMLEANVPAKVVQDILGHADVTLTLDVYSHVIKSKEKQVANKMERFYNKITPTERTTKTPIEISKIG